MKFLLKYIILIMIAVTALAFVSNDDETIDGQNGFAVVQLFTSQGCSSCPSADKLLDKVKEDYRDDEVFVLSYHVDYWNRLGWKDPFSKAQFSNTQRAYARKFGEGRIYTPQAVINGSLHFVGSNESKMKTNLSRFLNDKSKNSLVLKNSSINGENIEMSYEINGDIDDKNIKLALVIDEKSTKVKRGENGGRTIKNSNIVVEELDIPLSSNTGTAKITIPEIVEEDDRLQVIAYLQDKNLKILAATSIKI